MSNRYLRQLGIVNQNALSQLRVLVSGSANGIADILVLLDQLGVSSTNGTIGIHSEESSNPDSVFWCLAFDESPSFEALSQTRSDKYIIVKEIEPTSEWDIHLSINGSLVLPNTIYARTNGPRALISMNPIVDAIEIQTDHPLTPSIRVACCSALIERMLRVLGLTNRLIVSDAWTTATYRIETTDLQLANSVIQAKGLEDAAVNFQPSSDGLATLARIRLPYDPRCNPHDYLSVEKESLDRLGDTDVGLIPWDDTKSSLNQLFDIDEKNIVVLGAGGLGSWCAPLMLQMLPSGEVHIVDSDEQVEQHNLNRQVLYNEQHIGLAKAIVAQERLSSLNPNVHIRGYIEHLLPGHINQESLCDEVEFEADDLDDNLESGITTALQSSSLYFACLDNMKARTLLNEAALLNHADFVNGGSESVHGIVERMSNEEGCMVCRYGKETANEVEVVSCTEEGVRPIASIATTTAWAGAIMAAIGLVQSSQLNDLALPRFEWHKGSVQRTMTGSKPPWMNEPRLRHI